MNLWPVVMFGVSECCAECFRVTASKAWGADVCGQDGDWKRSVGRRAADETSCRTTSRYVTVSHHRQHLSLLSSFCLLMLSLIFKWSCDVFNWHLTDNCSTLSNTVLFVISILLSFMYVCMYETFGFPPLHFLLRLSSLSGKAKPGHKWKKMD